MCGGRRGCFFSPSITSTQTVWFAIAVDLPRGGVREADLLLPGAVGIENDAAQRVPPDRVIREVLTAKRGHTNVADAAAVEAVETCSDRGRERERKKTKER